MASVPDYTTAWHVLLDWSAGYTDNPEHMVDKNYNHICDKEGLQAGVKYLLDELDSLYEAEEMARGRHEDCYPKSYESVADFFDTLEENMEILETMLGETMPDDDEILSQVLTMKKMVDNVIEVAPREGDECEADDEDDYDDDEDYDDEDEY